MAVSGVLPPSSSQNSDFHPKCEDDQEDANLIEESQALVQEAKDLLNKQNCRNLHLHDLGTRSDRLIGNDADYPDQVLSDSSSPWSTSSEAGNLHQDLHVPSNILSKADGVLRETGDRVMSRRSIQQLTKDDLFAQPPPSYCHAQTRRLNSATMNAGSPMRAGLENFPEDIHPNKLDENTSIFNYINAYKGQEVEIGTILKPFIPNYILAVGAIDEFIKVPRPDKKPDQLGLKVLDESGAKQSDPAIMMLRLCATSHQPNLHLLEVPSIENASKNAPKLDAWIKNIRDLHASKSSNHVIFSKAMPSIEKLVQEWPLELEKVFDKIQQPTPKLDADLTTFVDICCSVLDIPVYKSRVESLHVMFSLFLELRNMTNQSVSESCKWVNVESNVFN
ncbi:unnamed protein product [Calypogeia fissa]